MFIPRLMVHFVALWLLLAPGSATAGEHPDFDLPAAGGGRIALADFRGEWVVVNFWATWCPPCLEEMPELDAFHRAHADQGHSVIGVNFETISPERLDAFVQEHFGELAFPIALSDARPVQGFSLLGMPTTFIIDPQGRIADTHLGKVDRAMLERRLEMLGASVR